MNAGAAAVAAAGGLHCGRWNQLLFLPLFVFLVVAVVSISTYPSATTTTPPLRPASTSRVAVCIVGGARRFELTGPSIVDNLLRALAADHQHHSGVDLFVHSPLDENAYKLSLLKDFPSVAAVRIFSPATVPETEEHRLLLTANGSPNGLQGLLRYFNLVEGCLRLITEHESRCNFTYGRIVRARADSFWSGPLDSAALRAAAAYVVPVGSRYGGFNDRLGIGDRSSSEAALSRLSFLGRLAAAGLRELNSERAFQAQMVAAGTPVREMPMPFCIVTDRRFPFPPGPLGLPVASMASAGPLNGIYCRACRPACTGRCAVRVCSVLERWWSWCGSDCGNGTVELCDSGKGWGNGWEQMFDASAGPDLAAARVRVAAMDEAECVRDMVAFRGLAGRWDSPSPAEVCRASRRWST